MNRTCEVCKHIRNCLNGKYCTLVGKYVEYRDFPVCGTDAIFEKCPYCNSQSYTVGIFLSRIYNHKCMECGKFFNAIMGDNGFIYQIESDRVTKGQYSNETFNRRCQTNHRA